MLEMALCRTPTSFGPSHGSCICFRLIGLDITLQPVMQLHNMSVRTWTVHGPACYAASCASAVFDWATARNKVKANILCTHLQLCNAVKKLSGQLCCLHAYSSCLSWVSRVSRQGHYGAVPPAATVPHSADVEDTTGTNNTDWLPCSPGSPARQPGYYLRVC